MKIATHWSYLCWRRKSTFWDYFSLPG